MNGKISEFIQRHGFGIFVALVLLAELLGFNPHSPLADLRAHVNRDVFRETLLLRICLNTSKDEQQMADCWAALFPDTPMVRR